MQLLVVGVLGSLGTTAGMAETRNEGPSLRLTVVQAVERRLADLDARLAEAQDRLAGAASDDPVGAMSADLARRQLELARKLLHRRNTRKAALLADLTERLLSQPPTRGRAGAVPEASR